METIKWIQSFSVEREDGGEKEMEVRVDSVRYVYVQTVKEIFNSKTCTINKTKILKQSQTEIQGKWTEKII